MTMPSRHEDNHAAHQDLSPDRLPLCSSLNAAATEEIDEFGDEQATFVRWNDCQAYRDRLKFGNEGERTWLRNRVLGRAVVDRPF